MSPKRTIILSIAILFIGFCVLWLISPAEQRTKTHQDFKRDLGFDPPEDAAVSVLGRDEGFNSETVYVKMTMDRKSWESMFSKPPFPGLPATVTTNPFLKLPRASIPNWDPETIAEGIGGITDTDSHKNIVFLFDISNEKEVVGYLSIIN